MENKMSPVDAKSRLSKFKDKKFRSGQLEAIEWVMASEKKYICLEAPTGSGKTLIGMTCGIMMGDVSYLCSTKILQTQIASDFAESKILWGRSNYPCVADNTKFCDQCISTKSNPCIVSSKCLYKIAKTQALESSIRTLNYSYYIAETQFAGRLSGGSFVVVDECDALEQNLINSVQLEFSERVLYRLGLVDGPSRKTVTSKDGLSSWKEFGTEALHRSKSICDKLDREIESFETIENEYELSKLKERDQFVHLYERCQTFLSNVNQDWILETQERQGSKQGKLIFKPLWLSEELSSAFLFKHASKFLLMSATLLPKLIFAKTLGLDPDDIDYMSLPSNFPVENRPINVWPVADMSNKKVEESLPVMVNAIKKILSWYPNERGLIQGVSYALCQKIHTQIGSNRLKIHNSTDRQEVLDAFIGCDDNSVLLSPSMERGVSLEGSKCTFIICIKAPYLSLNDKTTSQRLYGSQLGQVWYRALMMTSIVQSCGRGMRSFDDHCVCYLIDSKINEIYTRYPSLFPPWFAEAITWGENKLIGP